MSPPRVARRILEATIPAPERADVLENLDDLYAFRRGKRGRLAASLWYWRQAIGFSVRVHLAGALRPRRGSSGLMGSVVGDIRYAFRSLRRTPGFLVAVVATLGLGFGATVVVFSVVNASVLRPLPFPEADRLVWVWSSGNVSPTHERFARLRPEVSDQIELTAFAFRSYSIQGADEARIVTGTSVTTNHFDVIGLPPVLGRALRSDDGFPGAEPVAVISHELWRGHFGADTLVVGRSVDLFTAASIPMIPGAFTGTPHRIVGVLPPRYRPFGFQSEVYTPLVADPDDPNYGNMGELALIGRMRDGTDPETVRAELVRVTAGLPAFRSLMDQINQEQVTDLREALYGSLAPAMFLALGAVGLVLLIACANVANLVLSRSQRRARELGIRNAIGAGRGRLVRQLLTESLVLSTLGAVVGLVAAYALLPTVSSVLPPGIVAPEEVVLDTTVLLFAGAALLVATVVAGVAPAVVSTRRFSARLSHTNRRGSRGPGIKNTLVIAEIALALVLAYGAGLLVKSFNTLTRVDPGFSPTNVVTVRVAPTELRYRGSDARRALFAEVLQRARAIPGVTSAGAIHFLPIAEGGPGINFLVDPADSEDRRSTGYRVVTPGYLEAMGIPLLRGRDIQETDVAGGIPVGLINRSLATQLWPEGEAIGRTLYRTNGAAMATVVGVVGDVTQGALGLPPRPELYIPLAQTDWASAMSVVVRSAGRMEGLQTQLRDIVKAIDPGLPVTRVASMEQVMRDSVASPRFYGLLFSLFAVLALTLGGIGIYGVVSGVVVERRDEIGIRLALGATRDGILRREVLRGGRAIVMGLLAGLVLSFAATRLLTSMLYEVSPADPAVALLTGLILTAVAFVAVSVPAMRAARTDPIRAIRSLE